MEEEKGSGASFFGTLLRRHRLAAGLSQEELAERARMSADGVSALERGHRKTPQRETLSLLADALALDEGRRREFEAAGSRSTAGAAPAAGAPHRSALPGGLASFVGRERELDEIEELLRGHRLVTLTGAGGVGKTQTALHAARSVERGGVRAWFVGLVAIAGPASVTEAIAAAVGVREIPTRPLLECLVEVLNGRSALLVLDNCEHVIEQAALVAGALVAGCPYVRILATSREPLRSAGERTYRLPSLGAEAASALFADRARAVDHRFELSAANAPLVAELCLRLDGIPLAIELAAARVNLLSIESLAKKLDDRFRILAGGARAALPRQQTMRAAIDWSYDLLSERERRAFERISVFAGGCTLEAATQVCSGDDLAGDDVFDVLSSLVDKSLVLVDRAPEEVRYRFLESFREYADEKLTARGERARFRRRHLIAYLDLAERVDRAYYDDPGAYRWIGERELDNWRLSLAWSLGERHDVALGGRLAAELAQTVWLEHAPLEGRRWIAAALDLTDDATPSSTVGKLSHGAAVLAQHFRETQIQLEMARRAVECFGRANDARGIASAQTFVADALLRQGSMEEARALQREALAAARELGVPRLAAYVLRGLGSASFFEGDVAAARAHLSEALREYERAGAALGAASTLSDLSVCDCVAGDLDGAIEKIDRALAVAREFRQTRSVIHCLINATTYLILRARYDDAFERASEALQLAFEQQRGFFAFDILHGLAISAALRPHMNSGEAVRCGTIAARILGFVDANGPARGWARRLIKPHEYERVLDALRAGLGAGVVADLMGEGAAMTEERICSEALELLGNVQEVP